MPDKGNKPEDVTEYHVVYVEDPEPRWEVRWDKRRMGYQAWDKRVATSAAKDMAKKNRPSKVIIHDRKAGKPQSEMSFGADAPKRSKGVSRKLD
jgi:hypothetical protein